MKGAGKSASGAHVFTAANDANIFIVAANDGETVVMEHCGLLLDWLDDPTAPRGQLHFRGMNAVDAASPLLDVGAILWWSPQMGRLVVEATSLDETARRQDARARAALPTLPLLKDGDEVMVVLWEDLGGKQAVHA